MFRITFFLLIAVFVFSSCTSDTKRDKQESAVLEKISGDTGQTKDIQKPAKKPRQTPIAQRKDQNNNQQDNIEIQTTDTGFIGPNTDPRKDLDVNKVTKVFFNRGIREFKAGRYERSMQEFKKVTQMQPEHAKAYYNIGLCKYKTKDYYGAIDEFKTSYDLNPNDSATALYLGIVYNTRGFSPFEISIKFAENKSLCSG
ncbi:MAG: tetratricopeptide repeat protein [Bacteroidales bacterium]|nr:tetratricopeptide repeat protein [Bacteroidales bacterium]